MRANWHNRALISLQMWIGREVPYLPQFWGRLNVSLAAKEKGMKLDCLLLSRIGGLMNHRGPPKITLWHQFSAPAPPCTRTHISQHFTTIANHITTSNRFELQFIVDIKRRPRVGVARSCRDERTQKRRRSEQRLKGSCFYSTNDHSVGGVHHPLIIAYYLCNILVFGNSLSRWRADGSSETDGGGRGCLLPMHLWGRLGNLYTGGA